MRIELSKGTKLEVIEIITCQDLLCIHEILLYACLMALSLDIALCLSLWPCHPSWDMLTTPLALERSTWVSARISTMSWLPSIAEILQRILFGFLERSKWKNEYWSPRSKETNLDPKYSPNFSHNKPLIACIIYLAWSRHYKMKVPASNNWRSASEPWRGDAHGC